VSALTPKPPDGRAELRHYRGDHGAHAHTHAQLLFGLDGQLEVEVEGRLARVDAQTGLVVPAGARHASLARHGARVWVLDTPEAAGLEHCRVFRLPAPALAATDAAHLLALAGQAPRAQPRRHLDADALAEQVRARLHEDWPVARLAAACALSAPQFSHRWRALTGHSPQAWLRGLRLDRASALLATGLGAEAVAARVGYASASALLFALRRERGTGARALRRG
jgi:AraC-like DNA-binding protein